MISLTVIEDTGAWVDKHVVTDAMLQCINMANLPDKHWNDLQRKYNCALAANDDTFKGDVNKTYPVEGVDPDGCVIWAQNAWDESDTADEKAIVAKKILALCNLTDDEKIFVTKNDSVFIEEFV